MPGMNGDQDHNVLHRIQIQILSIASSQALADLWLHKKYQPVLGFAIAQLPGPGQDSVNSI